MRDRNSVAHACRAQFLAGKERLGDECGVEAEGSRCKLRETLDRIRRGSAGVKERNDDHA